MAKRTAAANAKQSLTCLRKRLAKQDRDPTPEEVKMIQYLEGVIAGDSETFQEDHRTPTGAPPEGVPKSTSSAPTTYEHLSGRAPDPDLEDRLARKVEEEVRAAVAPFQVRQDTLEDQIKDARYNIGMLTGKLVELTEQFHRHDPPAPEILQQLVSGDQALRKYVEDQKAEIRRQLETIEAQHRLDLKRVEDAIAVTDGMHYVADILKEINKNLQKLTKAVQGPGGSP